MASSKWTTYLNANCDGPQPKQQIIERKNEKPNRKKIERHNPKEKKKNQMMALSVAIISGFLFFFPPKTETMPKCYKQTLFPNDTLFMRHFKIISLIEKWYHRQRAHSNISVVRCNQESLIKNQIFAH